MEQKPIAERAQDFYNSMFTKTMFHLLEVAQGTKKPTKKEIEEYGENMREYPQDIAERALRSMCYGVDKETIYYITLAGGGPAARIRVEVEDGEVQRATLQFQDWFEPWTDAPHQDSDLVEQFARIVGYYEE